MPTPRHGRRLVAGFFLGEGVIASRADLAKVKYRGRVGDSATTRAKHDLRDARAGRRRYQAARAASDDFDERARRTRPASIDDLLDAQTRSRNGKRRPAHAAARRIRRGPDGLVRIALKKSFSDRTTAVDLDALSILTRLCAAVPPPRPRTVRRCSGFGEQAPSTGTCRRRARPLGRPGMEVRDGRSCRPTRSTRSSTCSPSHCDGCAGWRRCRTLRPIASNRSKCRRSSRTRPSGAGPGAHGLPGSQRHDRASLFSSGSSQPCGSSWACGRTSRTASPARGYARRHRCVARCSSSWLSSRWCPARSRAHRRESRRRASRVRCSRCMGKSPVAKSSSRVSPCASQFPSKPRRFR